MTQSNTLILEHAEAISWRRQFLRDVLHGLERPRKIAPLQVLLRRSRLVAF